MVPLRPFVLIALCAAAAPVAAALYKWTDANGVVHYTQTPPVSGPYESLRPAPPPGAAPAREATQKFLEQAERREAEQAKARAEARQRAAEAARRCRDARARLALLEERTPRRLAVQQENGELARMTVEEWEARKAQAQKVIEASCG